MIQFIVISSAIIVGIAVFLICFFARNRYDKFVWKNSICLKRLQEINNRYIFYPRIKLDQSHTYDNEKYYDTISCTDYLIYQLQYIEKSVLEQIRKLNFNQQQYTQYLDEVKSIMQFGNFSVSIGRMKPARLIKIEKQLFEKQTRLPPNTQFNLCVILYCSTMSGRIYERKSAFFSAEDISVLLKRLHNKCGMFFNDRGIWDAICRVERGKVSNKMRFSIYERDGYRCRCCGISDRYAQLEIDHIIPIARGGKSTYENLQTLCHRCNIEKSDRW